MKFSRILWLSHLLRMAIARQRYRALMMIDLGYISEAQPGDSFLSLMFIKLGYVL